MKFYHTFKQLIGLRSPRVKLALLAAGRAVGMRYVGMFIDPVLACNLRCRMCYFSDPEHVRGMAKGVMKRREVDLLRKSVMRHTLKLQIGCGAEPTLYKDLVYIIRAGKEEGIPYIEMTTNGQLLTLDSLKEYIQAGLDGITISLHGTTAETYEHLMAGASFEKFLGLIEVLKEIKLTFPQFNIRINFTANNLNKNELTGLWDLIGDLHIDLLQVRPIQKIGESSYQDFTIENYEGFINDIILPLSEECKKRGATPLLPSADNILRVNRATTAANALVEEVTYCYIAPQSCYREGFSPENETIKQFQSRAGIARKLWRSLFSRGLSVETAQVAVTKKLNYK